MDEPLSNLDAKLRIAMRVELKRLQSELGVTTIYVTHDQVEAMTLAHRVAVMDEGVLQQVAPPKEIYDDPANLFVARFIGAPAMNIVRGTVENGNFALQDGTVPLGSVAARGDVYLGFRPEDAALAPVEAAMLRARIYSTEMTGNETIVTCDMNGEHGRDPRRQGLRERAGCGSRHRSRPRQGQALRLRQRQQDQALKPSDTTALSGRTAPGSRLVRLFASRPECPAPHAGRARHRCRLPFRRRRPDTETVRLIGSAGREFAAHARGGASRSPGRSPICRRVSSRSSTKFSALAGPASDR